MFDFNSLIAGFESRRQDDRREAQKRADADDAREFALLQALAQHPDPEAAAYGAAGLLNLASAKPGKGLKGFFGEIERSSYYPQVKEWLQANGTPGAQPGTGALPQGSPVEPSRQGPGMAPTLASGPTGGAPTAPGGVPQAPTGPQTLGPYGQAAAEALLPPEGRAPQGPAPMGAGSAGAAAEGPPGPPVLGSRPVTPLPPRPESPQMKYRRLYPTAGELAAEQTYQTQFARIKAVLDILAQNPGREDIVRGMTGSPERRLQPRVILAKYVGADGQPGQGSVVFDPNTQGFSDSAGNPVSQVVEIPKTGNRTVVGPTFNQNGQRVSTRIDPATGELVAMYDTGMPVAQPPDFGGFQVDATGNYIGMPRQYGQDPYNTGIQARPTGTYMDPEAKGMLATVQQEIRARQTRNTMGQQTPVPSATADEIVRTLSKGRWRSFAELNAAAQPRPMSQAPQYGGGGDDLTDRRNRIFNRLEQMGVRPPTPGVVTGGGIPPGP